MTIRYAVTFEFESRPPLTHRGMVQSSRSHTCAARAIRSAQRALKPVGWSSLVFVCLGRVKGGGAMSPVNWGRQDEDEMTPLNWLGAVLLLMPIWVMAAVAIWLVGWPMVAILAGTAGFTGLMMWGLYLFDLPKDK